MPLYRTPGFITIGILLITLFASALWYGTTTSPLGIVTPDVKEDQKPIPPLYEGDFAVVNLKDMTVELRHGTSTLSSMKIINIGKPGSYYETIGGAYENDYKIKNHLSTIGHVYMPWSVHVFGNFFIHGIPYYANGTKVSSEYSGGCIRLSDEDAKRVYDFVQQGTPIIVTENNDSDFAPLATSTQTIPSMDMTRYMAATVSLEVLTQDDTIYDQASKSYTTRRKLLPRLIVDKEDSVIHTYASARGDETFLMYMNLKARALGLTNTTFASPYDPATTTPEDLKRFSDYITTYKTYLLTLATSTQPVASQ
jgi:hypothetical protein